MNKFRTVTEITGRVGKKKGERDERSPEERSNVCARARVCATERERERGRAGGDVFNLRSCASTPSLAMTLSRNPLLTRGLQTARIHAP